MHYKELHFIRCSSQKIRIQLDVLSGSDCHPPACWPGHGLLVQHHVSVPIKSQGNCAHPSVFKGPFAGLERPVHCEMGS